MMVEKQHHRCRHRAPQRRCLQFTIIFTFCILNGGGWTMATITDEPPQGKCSGLNQAMSLSSHRNYTPEVRTSVAGTRIFFVRKN